ncbi:Uncharacterised protein [Mycobacteroides abscessus]|nr:Uncharacterised protein [Mycobacteroides abscessus]
MASMLDSIIPYMSRMWVGSIPSTRCAFSLKSSRLIELPVYCFQPPSMMINESGSSVSGISSNSRYFMNLAMMKGGPMRCRVIFPSQFRSCANASSGSNEYSRTT